MMNRIARTASALAALLLATATLAQTNTPALSKATNWKPAWLTEVSLSFRQGYDNNVYASGCASRYYPAYVVYPGSVLAEKNHAVFFEMFTPKVATDFAKIMGEDSLVKKLAFSYAPDFVAYNGAPSEDYIAHRLVAAIILKCDDLTFQLDEAFTDIEGSKYGPTFPGKYYSAYGQPFDRERRAQLQDRTTVSLTYDQPSWFIRPTASLLGYDMHTDLLPVIPTSSGYLNYPDRFDLNGGADLGYKLDKELAVTLGYRAGEQYQQRLPPTIDTTLQGQTADNDYQRILLGIEGKLTTWLSGKVQAGPDFRHYGASAPVRDSNPVTWYGEGALTATASKDDTITLTYRRWRWVSSTAYVPDDESNYELTYKHRFNDQWSAKLGFRAQCADYSCGEAWTAASHNPATATTNFRNDWLFTPSAGVQYDITTSLSLDLAYAANLGRNEQDRANLAALQLPTTMRQFDEQIISMGAKYKF